MGGYKDGKIEIFDVLERQSVRCLEAPGGRYQYSLLASGGLLLAGGYSGHINVWNVETWELVHTERTKLISTICLSEDAQLLGCSGGAGHAHYSVYEVSLANSNSNEVLLH